MNEGEILAARQLLMRSVYLAHEQPQEEEAEEVAAAVVDKCALQLSRVVLYPVKPDDEGHEEAVGWFGLQWAPGLVLPRFRLVQVYNLLGTRVRVKRQVKFIIQKSHQQLREAAREVDLTLSSMNDGDGDNLACDILIAYKRVAKAAVWVHQLSQAVHIFRDALSLAVAVAVGGVGSCGSGEGGPWEWQQCARAREEVMYYRMGRLLVKLRPWDGNNLTEALAMLANSLKCASLDDSGRAADEKWRLRRAKAVWWTRLLIPVLQGCPSQHFAEAAKCEVLEELVGVGCSPISQSHWELMECLVEAAEVLILHRGWEALVIDHMEAVRAQLMQLVAAPESSGSSRSGAAEALRVRCTKALASACCERGEEAAAAAYPEEGTWKEGTSFKAEVDAAVGWYHKAADLAGAFEFPPERVMDSRMSHLCYRIGELQFQAGALKESLEMLSNSLRHVLSAITVTRLDSNSASSTGDDGIAGHVPAVCRLVEQVLAVNRGVGWDLQDAITGASGSVPKAQITLGWALCELANPEGIMWLEAAYPDASRGAAAAMGSISGDVEDSSFFRVQKYLAWAYSMVAQDSSKAAQQYELCRDMASRLDNRLSMQLCAAHEWAQAGELPSAEEAVLEVLEYLFPAEPASASTSNSELGIMSILRGGSAAAAGSLWEEPVPAALQLLALAATLPQSLWQLERMQPKLKATLQALRELCRLAANDLDYLKKERVMQGLILLVEWVAAAELLEALAPRLKDLYHQETPMWRDFTYLNALWSRHSRHHLQAARVLKDLSSAWEDASASNSNADVTIYSLLLSSALAYCHAGQYLLAEKLLKRLEQMIQAKKSWPPPGPDSDGVGLKQHFEYEICLAQAALAMDTRRFDQAAIRFDRATSLLEAIISDIQQRKQHVPDANSQHVRKLMTSLTMDAHLHAQLHQDDVDGLEARIERIEELDRAGAELGVLRARLLLQKGDHVGASERMREEFMRIAERQGRKGGDDDDSWITDYYHGPGLGLGKLVDVLENFHLDLQQPERALLWAERGRMRLFMHRVQQQQQQQEDPDDPEPATHNYDFDRDDGEALDMLQKVLLACGPNVALLEYSFSVVDSRGLRVLRIYCLFRDAVAGPPYRMSCYVKVVPDCQGIEQLVNKARDSIIVTPAADKKHRLALAKLHSLLVAPVQDQLHKCDTLIVVPDGCLSLVPFAALYDEGAGQFLIQQKQVVEAPCLRALYRCLNLEDRFSSTASTLQQPFVAGDPRPMGLGMAQLPHAEEEAAAVASILGVKPCLGAAMTREAVVEGLCGSSVVLLSTHATAKSPFPAGALVLQGPVTSAGVRMAGTTAASSYDPVLRTEMTDRGSDQGDALVMMRGFMGDMASVTEKSQVLTAKELSGMRIRAGLVVLSACETGRGEVTSEGVLGLGRALLQAGAATTVLSLWKVDDEGTKNLITEMFQELHNGEPVGTALRKSMLKMIQEGCSIYHWAPFFILGSPTVDLRNVTTLKGKNRQGRSSEVELGPTFWSVLKNSTLEITTVPHDSHLNQLWTPVK